MRDYYSQKLSAERLRRVYEIAPPRVKRYLDAEVDFVSGKIKSSDRVLELGCGYGRVLKGLAVKANRLVGIDTSLESLKLARELGLEEPKCRLLVMNAARLGFRNGSFDLVLCIQNGISAFHEDRRKLIQEALRVTRPGGLALFSSYAEVFWPDRLEWFRLQAEHGLLGEIDEEATGNGVIVGKDGFKATTLGPEDFRSLAAACGVEPVITEVNHSSIFCEIHVT